jgi:secreted trypsin-like serine protease
MTDKAATAARTAALEAGQLPMPRRQSADSTPPPATGRSTAFASLRTATLALLLGALVLAALPFALAFGQQPFALLDDAQDAQLIPDPYDETPSLRSDSKIVGGETAAPSAWPWQVAVYRRVMKNTQPLGREYLFCGGSLVHSKWVLTAAHCFDADGGGRYDRAADGDLIVVEGTNMLTPSRFGGGSGNGRKHRVRRIVVHEQWNSRSRENDIALLELSSSAMSKPVAVSSAQLPSRPRQEPMGLPADDIDQGTVATVTGWGHLGFNDPRVPVNLMQVEIPVVSQETCKQSYRDRGGVIDRRNICAGDKEGGRDACSGDSGGPLVVRRSEGGYVQIGIVSWGRGCGLANYYGVYTRVSAFNEWIGAKTGIARLSQLHPAAPGVASGSQPGQPQPVTPVARPGPKIAPGDRALLIGIEQYQNPKFNLKGSVNDVRNMERLLTNTFGYRREQIVTLLDAQATRANILKAFEDWLIRESTRRSRLLLREQSRRAGARPQRG